MSSERPIPRPCGLQSVRNGFTTESRRNFCRAHRHPKPERQVQPAPPEAHPADRYDPFLPTLSNSKSGGSRFESTVLRSKIRLSCEMKAVGVFAVNDTRARLGSPALLTKLRSSSLVLQVACCCFLAGGFLSARARGFCVLVGGLCLFFFDMIYDVSEGISCLPSPEVPTADSSSSKNASAMRI